MNQQDLDGEKAALTLASGNWVVKIRKIPIHSGVTELELELVPSGSILSRSKTLRHKADCCGEICSSSPMETR